MVKKYIFLIYHILYSPKEKEEKVVKVAKPATVKEPQCLNQCELDFNSQWVEYFEF